MAVNLIERTKLDACLDAEADAIRAKTGDSNDIAFDFANDKGFADAIAAIPSGGAVTGYTYLDTFNIQEDVRELLIDISSYDYGEYLLSVNATGTGADYLYVSITSSGSDKFLYITGNSYSKTLLISVMRPGTYGQSGTISNYFVFGGATALAKPSVTQGQQSSSTKPVRFHIFAYRSTGVINAGGTFTLYGRN